MQVKLEILNLETQEIVMFKEIVPEPNNNINNREFSPRILQELKNIPIRMATIRYTHRIKDTLFQIKKGLQLAKHQLLKLLIMLRSLLTYQTKKNKHMELIDVQLVTRKLIYLEKVE